MKKVLVSICLLLLTAGCSSNVKPDPTVVVVQITSSDYINPNAQDRPSPVVVRLYQLKSLTVFEEVDFFSLYERDESVLGQDLIRKDEIVVKPDEVQTLTLECKDETRAIGALAAFRDLDRAHWKSYRLITPNTVNNMYLDVMGVTAAFR